MINKIEKAINDGWVSYGQFSPKIASENVLILFNEELKIMDDVKMFLFARWISTCYADEHLDEEMRHSTEKGYDSKTAISVLNRKNGYWYKEKIKYFNDVIYPNYIKNGTVDNANDFFNTCKRHKNKPDCIEYQIDGCEACINCKFK